MSAAKAFLAELRAEIDAHPAVNHLFLNRLATTPFSREDYRIFGDNHYALVCVSTSYLERLMTRAPPDSDAGAWLGKVLTEARGEDSRGTGNAALYAHFLRAAGSEATSSLSSRVPSAALRFIAVHRRIVTREPVLTGLGAVGPGHEWAIPKMFEALMQGLRRGGFSEDEIQYFTRRVEHAEERGAWLEEALARHGSSSEGQAEIRRGALESLSARGAFWSGVQRAMVKYRTPRSARLDGPATRSLASELLLTAWEASPGAGRLEATLCALLDRTRPTLGDVLRQTKE